MLVLVLSSPWPNTHINAPQVLPAGHGMCLSERLMVVMFGSLCSLNRYRASMRQRSNLTRIQLLGRQRAAHWILGVGEVDKMRSWTSEKLFAFRRSCGAR